MFAIFAFELVLIYKMKNPTAEYIHFWTYMLLIYGIVVLIVLLSYQAKYLGKWTITGYNELQIELTMSLIFMMRNETYSSMIKVLGALSNGSTITRR